MSALEALWLVLVTAASSSLVTLAWVSAIAHRRSGGSK